MISAIFFLSGRGEVLISRIYRDDVPKGAADAFRQQVVQSKDSGVPPVVFVNGSTYLWIKQDQVYVVAITKENVNAAMVFEFLQKLLNLLKMYFVSDKITEEAIRGKFVLIYELLDEIMDFGYPQHMDYEILKQYILEGGGEGFAPSVNDQKKITAQATGAVTWRGANVRYRKNEIFLDVVESVNLLMSQTGTVLRSDVSGSVLVKCYLSGMPELKFGLNDKMVMEKEKDGTKARRSNAIEIDDMQFHQCVRLGKFDTDRTISFIPPDGEFELMKYRTTENINLPFKVLSNIKEHGRTRLDVKVSVKAQFGADLAASNVVVRIPTPKNTAVCKIAPTTGKAKYDPTTGGIVWKIRRFAGDSELNLSAEVELLAGTGQTKPWSRPPIAMEFQVPMFAASGLKVRFLKIYEKSNYPSVKWVRYLTKAGVYETRI